MSDSGSSYKLDSCSGGSRPMRSHSLCVQALWFALAQFFPCTAFLPLLLILGAPSFCPFLPLVPLRLACEYCSDPDHEHRTVPSRRR